jgi:3'-5' exoribonuclease
MTKKQLFIEQIEQAISFEEKFLVKYIAEGKGRDGRGYLNIILSDKTGQIEGRMWKNYESSLKNINPGDIALVKGKGNRYQKKIQVIIDNLSKTEEVDLSDFIVTSEHNSIEMKKELMDIINSLDDYYIKQLLTLTLSDSVISERLDSWSAAKSIHHAYQGGLLEHILSCSRLALSLSKHYEVNKNYVVAGAILHDLCKVYELSSGPVTEYTLEGKLVGHLVKGVELVERFSRKIPDFPYDLKLHLKHIVVSHHGEVEYGSPKVPSTLEAALVHYIDYLDSKMAALFELRKKDTNSGDWTSYDRISGRSVYKKELPFYGGPVEQVKTDSSKKLNEEKSSESLKNNDLANQLKGLKI